MFTITPKQEQGFDKIVLSNSTNIVEIIPNCGGILNAWHVLHQGVWINVIEGYDDETDFKNNCEQKGFRSCKLSPYVCRIKNSAYTFKEKKYTIGKFGFDENNIHGLMYDAPFDVVHQMKSENMALVQLETCYPATDKGYPFQYTILLEYVLSTDNQLTLTTTILNQHEQSIPMADGWHPYFTLGNSINQCSLQIASDAMMEFDEQLIPTGDFFDLPKFLEPVLLNDLFLDNCFLLTQPLQGAACVLANPQKNLKLSIYPSSAYRFLQVYTPESRSSIALENLSAPPDAFNNKMNLLVIEPNQTKQFSTKYQVSSI